MPLFPLQSLSQTCSLEDADADSRGARRVGQYRVGRQALYIPAFPGTRYLPFAALSHVWTKNTSISVTGCCGKQLPMICIRFLYDGEFYQNFLFEKQSEVDAVLERIRACRPDLPIDQNTKPLF